MSWKLVARMQVPRSATTREYRNGRNTYTWIDIRLGPSRKLRCECAARGEAIDLLRGVGRDGYQALGTCSHIEALYLGPGHVTEDKRTVAAERKAFTGGGWIPGVFSVRLVQLTKLGAEMFRWRWAQIALERST